MRKQEIESLLCDKILVLDGAMGTVIQNYKLSESDYRGAMYQNYHLELKGNNDLLSITQSKLISKIHEQYLEAGADIIKTNTFNANSISMADYEMENLVYKINLESARIAKSVADKYSTPDKPRFVAGSVGPTNKIASMSSKVKDSSDRTVTFDNLVIAYYEQAKGLIDGGVDILLVETICHELNAKAALLAIQNLYKDIGAKYPIMISSTINKAGKNLSGQTLEEFYNSIAYIDILSVGLNCAFGVKQLNPYLRELSQISKFYVSIHPNAGLPNQYGDYDLLAKEMANIIQPLLADQTVNIVGGCCGTTPDYINAIAELAADYSPRKLPEIGR